MCGVRVCEECVTRSLCFGGVWPTERALFLTSLEARGRMGGGHGEQERWGLGVRVVKHLIVQPFIGLQAR